MLLFSTLIRINLRPIPNRRLITLKNIFENINLLFNLKMTSSVTLNSETMKKHPM